MLSVLAGVAAIWLVFSQSVTPWPMAHEASAGTIDVAALREEATARFAPQVRAVLRDVPVALATRPLPRTAAGAAACFDVQTGAITLGEDLERAYGHAFALSALMHEYGHALAWHYYGWDMRVFRERFLSSLLLIDVGLTYPAFTAFVRRHYAELFTTVDYSEMFPAVLLELRSAEVLPPPLRDYVAGVTWP